MHLLNAIGLLKLSFGPSWVHKTKTSIIYETSRMLFSNMDFTLMHFTIVIRNGKIVWKHGPYLAEFLY